MSYLVVLASDMPLEVTAVAAILNHNTSGIISRKGEGMHSPKGLEGKRYSTWNLPTEQAIIRNVMEADGGDFDKVELIPNSITDEALALKENQTDAVWIYYGWSGINAEESGLEFDYWNFTDINPVFDFYTPVIAVNDTWAAENPELVKAFLRAAKRGYEYAAEYPKEAGDLLCKAVPELDPALIQEAQAIISPQYIADASSWGVIDEARWSAFYQWINDNQLSEKPFDPKAGFTMEYLEK